MAFASAASHRNAIADINVTPLVDVMLVLLIIFMVTAPLLDQRLPLALPQSTERARTEPRIVELAAEPGDVFALDGRTLAPGALQAELVRLREAEPGLALRVAIAPDADYQTAATALAAADRAGISNLKLE
ncbi:ExbD/TolR family protein [Arenimonas caeni]|jgi:biopolymer transport protein ExbD|uniref:Biopolymer transporter ExbD n=1 Tax=Arenimonas caeni TaxID=2058085 RepID=A0A2P6M7J3_9GAMM|nr:biopolymer transporter ExbD [Arenimonas caeni]MDY0021183.1 biopolymer transporter ExbD [Arenimonas caeni]PRH81957.1 biopolymer transporter ExbD [Arenimonas caeni]